MDYESFEAYTGNRSGSFELAMDPARAFPLFTAPGEILWAPGWEPFILHGDGLEAGTVWVTTAHGQETVWYVEGYDVDAKSAAYVRVTPGDSTGTVRVAVVPGESGGSTVHVTYQLTGLTPAGNERLRRFFEPSEYAAMLGHWRQAINDNRDRIDQHYGS